MNVTSLGNKVLAGLTKLEGVGKSGPIQHDCNLSRRRLECRQKAMVQMDIQVQPQKRMAKWTQAADAKEVPRLPKARRPQKGSSPLGFAEATYTLLSNSQLKNCENKSP